MAQRRNEIPVAIADADVLRSARQAADPGMRVLRRKIDCGSVTKTSKDRLVIRPAERLLQTRNRPR